MGRPVAFFVLSVYKVIRSVRVIRARATALDGLCRACGRAESTFGLHPSWSRLRRQTAAQGIVAVGG